jgi:hypothetical protein
MPPSDDVLSIYPLEYTLAEGQAIEKFAGIYYPKDGKGEERYNHIKGEI